MSTHNICFYGELEKLSHNYHQILLLNNSPAMYIYNEDIPSQHRLSISQVPMAWGATDLMIKQHRYSHVQDQ